MLAFSVRKGRAKKNVLSTSNARRDMLKLWPVPRGITHPELGIMSATNAHLVITATRKVVNQSFVPRTTIANRVPRSPQIALDGKILVQVLTAKRTAEDDYL